MIKILWLYLKLKVMTKRVEATEKAIEIIRELHKTHGDLMFYQSGGCCEGT